MRLVSICLFVVVPVLAAQLVGCGAPPEGPEPVVADAGAAVAKEESVTPPGAPPVINPNGKGTCPGCPVQPGPKQDPNGP
jgi:hypothetical protein